MLESDKFTESLTKSNFLIAMCNRDTYLIKRKLDSTENKSVEQTDDKSGVNAKFEFLVN